MGHVQAHRDLGNRGKKLVTNAEIAQVRYIRRVEIAMNSTRSLSMRWR